jgi:hypothetical protein
MSVSFVKKTDVKSAHRFFLNRQGKNVPVIMDVVEREDGTVWIVSPLGGRPQSRLSFDDTVSSLVMIESANGTLRRQERLV